MTDESVETETDTNNKKISRSSQRSRHNTNTFVS